MNLQSLNSAHSEYDIMQKLDHARIIQIKGFFEDCNYVIMVYELMTGDMRALLSEIGGHITEQTSRSIFQ